MVASKSSPLFALALLAGCGAAPGATSTVGASAAEPELEPGAVVFAPPAYLPADAVVTPLPDGSGWIVYDDASLRLIDGATGAERLRVARGDYPSPWIGADGRYALVFDETTVVAVDVRRGRRVAEREIPIDELPWLPQITEDGVAVWTTMTDQGPLHTWHLPSDALTTSPISVGEGFTEGAMALPGGRMAIPSDGDLRIVDLDDGREIARVEPPDFEIPGRLDRAVVTEDGRDVWLLSREGWLMRLSMEDWALREVVPFDPQGEEEASEDVDHGNLSWSFIVNSGAIWLTRPDGVQGLLPAADGSGERRRVGLRFRADVIGRRGDRLIGVRDVAEGRFASWSSDGARRWDLPGNPLDGVLLAVDARGVWSHSDGFVHRGSLADGSVATEPIELGFDPVGDGPLMGAVAHAADPIARLREGDGRPPRRGCLRADGQAWLCREEAPEGTRVSVLGLAGTVQAEATIEDASGLPLRVPETSWVALDDGGVRLLDLESGTTRWERPGAMLLGASPDGAFLVVRDEGSSAGLLSVADGARVATLAAEVPELPSVSWDAEGRRVAVTSFAGVEVHDVRDGAASLTRRIEMPDVAQVVLSADGSRVAIRQRDRVVIHPLGDR